MAKPSSSAARRAVLFAITLLASALFASGCANNVNRNTSDWMKSVNSIKPGTEMSQVKDKLGAPDSKRKGETPIVPVPPVGSPEGILSTLPPDTKYEHWIYRRGDSHYHVLFQRTATEPNKWEVIAVRSTPSTDVD